MVNQNISQKNGHLEVHMVDDGRKDSNYAELDATKHFSLLDAPLFNSKGDHP